MKFGYFYILLLIHGDEFQIELAFTLVIINFEDFVILPAHHQLSFFITRNTTFLFNLIISFTCFYITTTILSDFCKYIYYLIIKINFI